VDNGNGTGNFSWTPGFFQEGVYNVTFQAADTAGGVDLEIVSITVTNTNRDPVLDPIGSQAVAEGVNLTFPVTSSDIDNDSVTLTTSALPTGASFVDNGNGTGSFAWTPDFTQEGAYAVTFLVTDTAGGTDFESVSITVTRTNVDPVLAAIGPQSVAENTNLNFGVSATDFDLDPLVLSTSPLPTGATFTDNGNGTGTFDWTPDFTQAGSYPVTFRAFDTAGAADSEVVSITVTNVNRAPVLAAIGSQVLDEGTTLNLGTSASDPDGTTPAMTAENLPANATYVDNGNGTGTFDFNPDTTQAGVYNVTFIASDGALADSEVVSITVINVVNLVPVLTAIGPQNVAENANLNFGVSATDNESDSIILSAVPLPSGASFVDNGNGTGTFNWTPGFFQEGVYNVSFRAFDTLGRADSEVVAITVTNTNRDPVLNPIGPQTVAETVNLNLAITSSDSDNDSVTLTTSALPAGASFVDNGNGTGTFDWTPDLTQEGAYAVTFLVTDTAGGSDLESVSFTVTRTNVAPVLAAIGAQSVDENANLNFGVSASDFDLDPLLLTAVPLPSGASFVDNGNGTGTFDWTPTFVQAGVYNVTFTATDTAGASHPEVVSITVNNVNRQPVLAAIGPQNVDEGQNLNFVATATDPDGTTPTMTAVGVPANATYVDNLNGTGTFNFNPDFTQSGVFNVTFIATDGTLADTEVVAITVNQVNLSPTLAAIGPQSVDEDQNLNFVASATDPDGTTPTMTAVDLPANATYVDNLNGTGTFNFNPDFTQSHS
jgi:hypothetical protein